MLFVTLPFLLALWEYNLINIVERMSVEKKKRLYRSGFRGDEYACRPYRRGSISGSGERPDSQGRRGLRGDIGGFDRGDPFRVGRECGSYRYRCAERGGS